MIQWVGTSRLAELTWRRVQTLGSTHKAGHDCTQTCDSGTRGGGGRSIARAWWLPSRLHHQWEALSHQGKKEKRDIAPSSGICSHSYTLTYAHTPHIQATLTYTACTKYKTNKMAITTRSLSSVMCLQLGVFGIMTPKELRADTTLYPSLVPRMAKKGFSQHCLQRLLGNEESGSLGIS